MKFSEDVIASLTPSRVRAMGAFAAELILIGAAYIVLAKFGLALASIHPSATPIWPPSGFALAVILLRGYRVWPAILAAAFLANATTAGSPVTALAIAVGNTIECVLGAYLANRWCSGRDAYTRPGAIARISFFIFLPTAISATVGVGSLALAGFAEWQSFGSIWLTWWLGDLAGALVITPVIVLWAQAGLHLDRRAVVDSLALYAAAAAIGLIAFSPLVEQSTHRPPLGFLAVIPLLWSALRHDQRDTATVALILSCFAVWGTVSDSGPFARPDRNESFLMLLMFMISTAVPSLALSADVMARRKSEEELRRVRDDLNHSVERRTAALVTANLALRAEIDRRKQAETELDHQRLHLAEAQRLANVGSWIRDVDDERARWSDQLFEIHGMKPGPLAPTFQEFLQRVHPDDRERVRREVAETMSTGKGIRGERRIVRPNGEIRYLQTRVDPIKDANGRVVRMFGISLDVTERRQAELALEKTREQLAQAHKMEAIGQLTGGIAHDFNNLLMIVSGHADMLRRKFAEPSALKAIEAIRTATRRGESLTRQLLTFSRRQPLNPEPISLKERIEAIRAMLGSSLRGNITLAVDIPDDLWRVEVDVAELELALVNIAVNARDAMPDGGRFTLSARNLAAQTHRPGDQPAGDYVELSLSDTGAGIPDSFMKKIFDPFFTTKAVGKGTGLGLSQVYGFAQQSRGSVRVDSKVGSGTTLTLRLPRSHAVIRASAETSGPRETRLAEGTVLVVEDNPEVAEVTVALLEQMGYRVLRAENAVEALSVLQTENGVDLVFSDIVMPNGMNGIHLAQEISARYPTIGILLTTGYSDVATAAETRFPILRKPFEVAALERAVREALIAVAALNAQRASRGAAQQRG